MPLSLENPDVQDFLAFLRLKNVSIGTLGQYEWTLQDLFKACDSDLRSLQDVTASHLRRYVAELQDKGLKPKTIGDRVTILKQFFGYLFAEGHLQADPAQRLPLPRMSKRLPKALSLAETEALLLAVDEDAELGERDRILFELMYACGLRAGEAVQLRVSDIDFEDGSLRICGKGNKERAVFVKKILLDTLREYIEADGLSDLLFPGYRGKHLTVRNVELRIKQLAIVAGITRKVTPHTLRHSIAVHYLQGGAPINFIQTFLGHAKLSTTGRYLLLTDQASKQIVMNTPTALDSLSGPEKELGMREGRAGYAFEGELEMWDAYVTDVVEWLAAS